MLAVWHTWSKKMMIEKWENAQLWPGHYASGWLADAVNAISEAYVEYKVNGHMNAGSPIYTSRETNFSGKTHGLPALWFPRFQSIVVLLFSSAYIFWGCSCFLSPAYPRQCIVNYCSRLYRRISPHIQKSKLSQPHDVNQTGISAASSQTVWLDTKI